MGDRLAALLRRRDRGEGEVTFFAAFNATNALNYAYLLIMGLLLGTESYGLFGALFGVVYLVSAVGNTVQVAVARHVAHLIAARGGAFSRELVAAAFAPALALAALVGLAFLALSPLLAEGFDASSAPLLWTGLAVALSVSVPAGYGVLQGAQRFGWLGSSLLVSALVRVAIGGGLVGAGWGPSGALAGVAIGYLVSGAVTLIPSSGGRSVGGEQRVPRPSTQSLLAIFVASVAIASPTSLDVALVKHFFPAVEAGIFTAVAVLGRVVLFAPLAVPFILLPKVTARVDEGGDTTHFLWSSLGLTGVLSGGAALALTMIVRYLGWSPVGAEIEEALTPLYWYLPAMVAFSLVVTAVYYQLGRGSYFYVVALLFPGITAQAMLLLLFHDSLTVVAQVTFAINACLLAVVLIHEAPPLLNEINRRRPLRGFSAFHRLLGLEPNRD